MNAVTPTTSLAIKHEGRVFVRYIHVYREKGRTVAEFKPSINAKPLAKVGIKPELFEKFVKTFKLEPVDQELKSKEKIKGVVYATAKDEVFEIALLYTCVLRVLKNKEKSSKLIDKLLNLHPFELMFWNYKLINAGNKYEQDRIARAFLMLYKIDR